jgi:lipopolysaccharide transport system permease protein/teichoic acid transport system permease protein
MHRLKNSLYDFPPIKFIGQAFLHRGTIYAMALRDFESRYIGTLGGVIWTVIQPLATITVFYFVFAIGFRVQSPSDTPFILWFVCGLAPWFLFNDTLQAISSSVTDNAHLVKKTVFPTEVLALVKILSALLPHLIFLIILVAMLFFIGVPLSIERTLLAYYFICIAALLLGIGWLLSALQVFYRDIGHVLPIFLNVWFWATPIVWPEQNVPESFHWILTYNPLYYIVSGYRDSLIYPTVIWPKAAQTIYFWCFAASCILVGSFVFNRLKPEFADVI